MNEFAQRRVRMVEQQIARRGVRDPHVLDAMRRVPREMFVAEHLRDLAYADSPLPIESGQTISQPYIVALMVELAALHGDDRVLEIGTGSGYAAAVMAAMTTRVHTIERHAELTGLAQRRFANLGYTNIDLRTGDGSGGWPEAAPFDAIVVAAGAPRVPEVLWRQLVIGGRLVMPVGDSAYRQQLVRWLRTGTDTCEAQEHGLVRFVPLIGAHGWGTEQ